MSSDDLSSVELFSSALSCELLSLLSDLDRFFFFLCCLILAFRSPPSAAAEAVHCSLDADPPRGTLFKKAVFLDNPLFVTGCLADVNEMKGVEDPQSEEIDAAATITPAVAGRVFGVIVS